MLSRVGERTYWLGRYLERIESTARMINVNANLLLDLPRSVKLGWATLIDITGSNEQFFERFQNADERNVIRFLLSDESSPASISTALQLARENSRTTREILPSETWEQINDLHLYVADAVSGAVARAGRQPFLQNVIRRCQQLHGLLDGGLAYNTTRDFIALGRQLERADMTTRIVDVGTGNFLAIHAHTRTREELDTPEPFDSILWMSVLRSLSAFQMYRQHVRERVNGADVVGFLLQNALHPRSVVRCLTEMQKTLEGVPNADRVQRAVGAAQKLAWSADIEELLGEPLHTFIDQLQLAFAAIHEAIAVSWFLPRTTTTQ
jgi:uncharacterized alpha-E superfamily protein